MEALNLPYDAMVYDKTGNPVMLVECKAPSVKVNQAVFQQIAGYNIAFKVPYLFVTNGLKHYVCYVDHKAGKLSFMEDLPEYSAW
jgi:type I site-specific restriction endonuclease